MANETYVTDSLRKTEAECAEGRTAPRVKLDDILNSISGTYYSTGDRLLTNDGPHPNSHAQPLGLLTICLVVMNNGFTIIGKSAPASPENFDPELGKKLAHEDAIRQIWPLMGFNLRQKLHDAE